ncbi:DUF4097 family beta strand repeat-containing protein [Peribacillus butanolivorans]|uniref:DUF4097 family beta strand repeat-containing protein n=1 Tax=Peribacillus butanolivorans TaxID=421767 RepID=UPI00366E7C61
MKRKLFMIGVLTLIITGVFVALSKKNFEYKSDLKNVEKIIVDSDISNIVLVKGDSNMNIEYSGQKSFLGNPKIDIVYNKDQAIIKVKALPNKWMYILPGNVRRGKLILNIPAKLLEHVQIKTQNGNIDVKDLSEVNRLSLNSNVGNINVDSFKGESVNIEAKNGSIKLGTVDGEVKIKNQTGNLNSLVLSDIKGKNNIKLSNGSAKITLPNELDLNDIGFNISASNGRIISEHNKLSSDNITKRGAGQKIINRSKGNKELNISVSVGNIKIN